MTNKELCKLMYELIEWKRIPLDEQKIDEILDRDIDKDDKRQIINSLKELFNTLGLKQVFIRLGLPSPSFVEDNDNDELNEDIKIKKDYFKWRH